MPLGWPCLLVKWQLAADSCTPWASGWLFQPGCCVADDGIDDQALSPHSSALSVLLHSLPILT